MVRAVRGRRGCVSHLGRASRVRAGSILPMSRTGPAAALRPRDVQGRGLDPVSFERDGQAVALQIVVCDGEASTRFALKRLIAQELPCAIVECRDGAELRAVLETGAIDLLILDIEMPALDGVELLKEIRASSALRAVPVIVLSRQRRREMVVRLAELGIDGYLLKPLRRDTLRSSLERVRPRLTSRAARVPATGIPAAARSGAPSALIVDGDPAFRQFFVRECQLPGAVAQAASGTEGLALYRQAPCPMVFIGGGLGILAPEMLAARLRSLAAGRVLSIVRIQPAGHDERPHDRTSVDGSRFDRAIVRTLDPARLRTELAAMTDTRSGETQRPVSADSVLPPTDGPPVSEASAVTGAIDECPANELPPPEPAATPQTVDLAAFGAGAAQAVASASARVFGLLVDAELERRDEVEIGEPAIGARVDVTIEGKGVVVLGIRASTSSMSEIAARMLGKDTVEVNTDDVTSVAQELVRSIAGHALADMAGEAGGSDPCEPGPDPARDGRGDGRGDPDARVTVSFAVPVIEASLLVSLDLYVER